MIRALRQRAGRKQVTAAAEPDVLAELRGLRARVPHVTGALAASTDGLLLAQDTSGVSADQVAALITTALGIALRVTHATGQGGFRELLVRGSDGYVATYTAGRSTVLTLFAQDRVNVGRLHLEGRRTGLRIGELVDAEPAGSTVPAPDARTTRPSGRPETQADRTPPGSPPTTTATTTATTPAKSPTELPTAPPRQNSRPGQGARRGRLHAEQNGARSPYDSPCDPERASHHRQLNS